MAFGVWADGVWGEGVWAAGVWEGAGGNNQAPSVTINQGATANVVVGRTLQLTVTATDAEDGALVPVWTSDDELTATVSAGGVVTAVAVGQAGITATVTDSGALQAQDSIDVSVVAAPSLPGGSGVKVRRIRDRRVRA